MSISLTAVVQLSAHFKSHTGVGLVVSEEGSRVAQQTFHLKCHLEALAVRFGVSKVWPCIMSVTESKTFCLHAVSTMYIELSPTYKNCNLFMWFIGVILVNKLW